MHPTACTIVTQFCNPDMFSNTHGLLECFLQCKSKTEKTLQGVKTKLTRFVSDSISSTVSPTPLTKRRGETVFIKLITTKANPITREAAAMSVCSMGEYTDTHLMYEYSRGRKCHAPLSAWWRTWA